ncbi:hypothetical protein FB451DRAFT_1518418 [Mycena latifolia]|nr:hypothetical protein FB451DRAFT_1518418 [Mycena latifolia]
MPPRSQVQTRSKSVSNPPAPAQPVPPFPTSATPSEIAVSGYPDRPVPSAMTKSKSVIQALHFGKNPVNSYTGSKVKGKAPASRPSSSASTVSSNAFAPLSDHIETNTVEESATPAVHNETNTVEERVTPDLSVTVEERATLNLLGLPADSLVDSNGGDISSLEPAAPIDDPMKLLARCLAHLRPRPTLPGTTSGAGSSTSTLGCAQNADGSLRDAADISFFNDVDDEVPLPALSSLGCAQNANGSLRDPADIVFYNDVDDEVTLPAVEPARIIHDWELASKCEIDSGSPFLAPIPDIAAAPIPSSAAAETTNSSTPALSVAMGATVAGTVDAATVEQVQQPANTISGIPIVATSTATTTATAPSGVTPASPVLTTAPPPSALAAAPATATPSGYVSPSATSTTTTIPSFATVAATPATGMTTRGCSSLNPPPPPPPPLQHPLRRQLHPHTPSFLQAHNRPLCSSLLHRLSLHAAHPAAAPPLAAQPPAAMGVGRPTPVTSAASAPARIAPAAAAAALGGVALPAFCPVPLDVPGVYRPDSHAARENVAPCQLNKWDSLVGSKILVFEWEGKPHSVNSTTVKDLKTVIARITGSPAPLVGPPEAANSGSWAAPYMYLVCGVSDTDMQLLLSRPVWNMVGGTTFFAIPYGSPSLPFLFTLDGLSYGVDDGVEVADLVVSIIYGDHDAQVFLTLHHDNYPAGVDLMSHFAASVRVIPISLQISGGRSRIAWNVTATPPSLDVTDNHAWISTLSTLEFDSAMHWVGKPISPPRFCSGCKSAGHVVGICPLPQIPGWYIPKPPASAPTSSSAPPNRTQRPPKGFRGNANRQNRGCNTNGGRTS